jgi:hypothetical protein
MHFVFPNTHIFNKDLKIKLNSLDMRRVLDNGWGFGVGETGV